MRLDGATILVTGAHGQLGRALARTVPTGVEFIAHDRDELDVTDAAAIDACVDRVRPDAIVNAAAYTAVDRAEDDSEAAGAINGEAPGLLASAAARIGARLVHVSTDFIFDGTLGRPYRADDEPNPLSVYGRTKLAGELAVREVLGDDATIVRTAWVHGQDGGNFPRTMLRLLRERDELRVVCDQVGSPTWTDGLAGALWTMLERDVRGIHHWTDAGVASWYDVAVATGEIARSVGLLDRDVPIEPIPTEAFPTPAARPVFGVLDKEATWHALGRRAPHWRTSLTAMFARLAAMEAVEDGDG